MKDLRSLLQQGDPLAQEGGLSPDDRARLRRQILSAPRSAALRTSRLAFLAVAAALCVATVGGVLLTRTAQSGDPGAASVHPGVSPSDPPSVRQLQFSAPGGTRVIWTFNPAFK